ncbi:MAG: hypothetical protein H6625_10995 [Bdellovibrionaceae bacterium]|nr:hypothetical protein [Pseudobdellovibrionaceae bacterium]
MFEKFKNDWLEVFNYLKVFLVNPVQHIRTLPDWDWRTILFFLGLLGSLSGSLHGLVSGSFTSTILGFFFLPLSLTVIHFIIAGFFYYFVLFFLHREISYKQLFLLLILSNTPLFALYVLSPLASPLILLGIAFSGILLIVGFVDYFLLPRKPILRMILALFIFYILMWIWGAIQTSQVKKIERAPTTRENLDLLEKELKGN